MSSLLYGLTTGSILATQVDSPSKQSESGIVYGFR